MTTATNPLCALIKNPRSKLRGIGAPRQQTGSTQQAAGNASRKRKAIENGTLIEFTGRTYETVDVYGGYLIQEISEDPIRFPLEVYWDDKKAGYMARSIDEEHLFTTPLPEKDFRVVGNIFEDTALVEECKTLHKVLANKE